MNLIERLEKILEFTKKYNTLKKATKRVEKNIEECSFNANFVSGHNDDIDAMAKYAIISSSSMCSIGLSGLNIGLKNLHPITKRQNIKKQQLANTFEDLLKKYLQINPEFEVE